jgi:septal ring factor EnvC (AmiA/AmiB activator)
MQKRKPYLGSLGINDKVEQLKSIIENRYDLLKQDVHEKHQQNRESIHAINNNLQLLFDKVSEIEKEMAVISGSDKIPGELARLKKDLQDFKDNVKEIETNDHKNDLRWAKVLGWLSCLGFLGAGIVALLKWAWALLWMKH